MSKGLRNCPGSSRWAAPRSTRRIRTGTATWRYIMENWPQIASAAWAGYLAQGRGLTIVDTRKTYPVPTGLGHAISYLPAGLVTAADDARMVREYDPEREVVVGMLRANGDEDVYRLGTSRLTPKQAYEQTPKQ